MRFATILLAVACACGDRGPEPTAGARPAAARDAAPSASSPTITLAWSYGQAPTAPEVGPRARDPNEPLPTGPALFAVGSDRVAVATRDACLELLDLASGKPVVPRQCEKEAFASGLAVLDGVVITAVRHRVRGFVVADLAPLWSREDLGFIQDVHMVQPRAVGGAFCVVADQGQSGVVNVTCLEPKTGKTRSTIKLPQGSRIGLGDDVIAVIESGVIKTAQKTGHARPVRFYRPDGGVVSEKDLAGQWGPTIEVLRPTFAIAGAMTGGWRTRFVSPAGAAIVDVSTNHQLRGGALVGGLLISTEFQGGGNGDAAVGFDPATGDAKWRTPLDGSGQFPFVAGAGDRALVALADKVAIVEVKSGAVVKSLPIASAEHAVWGDRVLLLVEANGHTSDSDTGDAGVHAVDMASGTLLFQDDLGRNIPGGRRATRPIIAGNTAVLIAGARLRAYRMKP